MAARKYTYHLWHDIDPATLHGRTVVVRREKLPGLLSISEYWCGAAGWQRIRALAHEYTTHRRALEAADRLIAMDAEVEAARNAEA